MTPDISSQSEPPAFSIRLKAATAFAESFARLMKISSYYPEGHAVFEQAINGFRAPLAVLSEQGEPVEFLIEHGGCRVAGISVNTLSAVAEEMRQLFFGLGLYRILFHRTVSSKDLQQFVVRIFEWRVQAGSSGEFSFFSKDKLPSTIEVLEQEFTAGSSGTKSDATGSAGSVYGGIGRICRTLVDSGYNSSEVLACRDFLVEAAKSQHRKDGFSTSGSMSWEEVIELMTGMLDKISTGNGGSATEKNTDLNTIASIFERVGGQQEMNEAGRQAIDTLLGYFQNEAGRQQGGQSAAAEAPKPLGDKKEASELRISPSQAAEDRATQEQAASSDGVAAREAARQIREVIDDFVRQNSLPLDILKKLSSADHSEELSILLQLFLVTEERDMMETLVRRICQLTSNSITERERTVLLAGFTAIATARGFAGFYALTKSLLEELHREGGDVGLRFILKLYQRLDHHSKKFAWPFLVNEILIAGSEDTESFVVAAATAAKMALKEMMSLQPYLENLDAFSGKKDMAEVIFLSKNIASYPLYSFLLTTSRGKTINEKICVGLAQEPQDDMMVALSAVLEPGNRVHLALLQYYLRCRPQGSSFPAGLQQDAETAVISYLLSAGEKPKEEELARIIEAAGSFAGRSFIPVLEKIVNQKKMGLVTLWPPRCREAAATTLTALRKRL